MKELSQKQLRELHGKDYVERYHQTDGFRIGRMINLIQFGKNDVVLDIGCGNGLLLDYVADKVNRYYGVDFSEEFIKVARSRQASNKINNAEFICGDVTAFCRESEVKFDKIFALDFTEHIYNEDFLEIFAAISRSLNKEGTLYLHTPNRDYILEILKARGILRQLPEHVAVRTPEQYSDLLQQTGFREIEIVFLSHYLKIPSIFAFLRYVPLINKYFKARLFIKCKI
ncbi:MAG: class I SAM-dependent methyltransferase [Planctomycetota bacterium]